MPVDTGNLKRSGSIEDIPNGARIIYRAPYAADVEFGRPDRPITGTQTVLRRTASGGTQEVRYTNKRLIGFRPKYSKFEYGKKIFRVINVNKATRPQLFLTRACKAGLPKLPDDIAFCLKRIGKVRLS